MGDFIQKNTDKLLVLLALFVFYAGSWWAYKIGIGNLGDASIDIVKQLVAAFLTLAVAKGVLSTKNGNGTPINKGEQQ